MSTILITGAATGIGRLSAIALARVGHTVYATMREPEGRNAARAEILRTETAGHDLRVIEDCAHALGSSYRGRAAGTFSIEECWQHNLRVASYSRAILQAERASKSTIEEGVLAGMLHDAGQLVLATNRPERFQAAHVFAERDHAATVQQDGLQRARLRPYILGLRDS